jgi:hypothetical protein
MGEVRGVLVREGKQTNQSPPEMVKTMKKGTFLGIKLLGPQPTCGQNQITTLPS